MELAKRGSALLMGSASLAKFINLLIDIAFVKVRFMMTQNAIKTVELVNLKMICAHLATMKMRVILQVLEYAWINAQWGLLSKAKNAKVIDLYI